MTALLDRAVRTLRALPPEAQDDIARLLLQWTGDDQDALCLTPDLVASFKTSLEQADHDEFATDAEVAAVWAKSGL